MTIGIDVSTIATPQIGLFKLRLPDREKTRDHKTCWSAVRIWDDAERCPDTNELLEDENIRCLINGDEEVNPCHWAERINLHGSAILHPKYSYYVQLHQWAAEHDQDAPEADPRRAVDLTKIPPITP